MCSVTRVRGGCVASAGRRQGTDFRQAREGVSPIGTIRDESHDPVADALADDLVSHGVRPGERVLVWLPSRIETAVVQLACCRQGYVFCPSPHRNHSVVDVVDLLQRTRCAAFFYQPGFGWLRCQFQPGRYSGRTRKTALAATNPSHPAAGADGSRPVRGLAYPARTGAQRSSTHDPDRVSYLAFTSGSTGAPKGVMHSDNTLLAALRMMAADWRFGPNTVTYSLSPFSHNLGAGAWLTSLVVGGEFVVHDLPRGASLIDRLAETGASYLVGVPTHAIDLVEELRHRGAA